MSEIWTLMIGTLIFIILPIAFLSLPFILYGRRHSWTMRQYRWPMVTVGLGWFIVVALWVWDAPIDRVIFVTLLALGPALLFTFGLAAIDRMIRRKRRDADGRGAKP